MGEIWLDGWGVGLVFGDWVCFAYKGRGFFGGVADDWWIIAGVGSWWGHRHMKNAHKKQEDRRLYCGGQRGL